MTDEARDIAAELAYMAHHPELFAKKEMVAMLAAAAEEIAALRSLVGIQAELEFEDVEPKGNA